MKKTNYSKKQIRQMFKKSGVLNHSADELNMTDVQYEFIKSLYRQWRRFGMSEKQVKILQEIIKE